MPSTQPTQKRKRACDSCHKRKIQCDSADVPSANCNWCHHHGMACTFNRVVGRKTWARNSNTASTNSPVDVGPSPSSAVVEVVDVTIGPSSSDLRPPNASQSQPQLYQQQPHPSPLPPQQQQQPLPPLAAHLGISPKPIQSNSDLGGPQHGHSSLPASIDDSIYAQHLDPYNHPHSPSSSVASTPSGTSTSGFGGPTRPVSRSGGGNYHAFPFSAHTSESFHPSPLSRTHSPHGSVSSEQTHHTSHTPAQYQHQHQHQHQHHQQHHQQQQHHQEPEQVHPVYSHFPVANPNLNPNPGNSSYFGKLHFAGYHLGEISSYNGIPFFSEDGQAWIRSRTGQEASFPEIWGDVPPWQTRPSFDSVFLCKVARQPVGQLELPERKVVEQYVSFFIASEFRLAFPLVDPVLFEETLDLAYGRAGEQGAMNGLSFEQITAKACVFAFLSIISLLEFERTERFPDIPSIDTDMLAAKAQMLLPLTIQALDITSLQTSFMLCLYQLFLGQVQSSAMLLAFACRIMFMLGGHKLSNASWLPTPESRSGHGSGTTTPAAAPVDIADRKRRHLRKLFWLCYSIDTDISLRTGQPPSIDDDHCDLSLPPGYLEIQYLDRHELEALKERHLHPTNSSPSFQAHNSSHPFQSPSGAGTSSYTTTSTSTTSYPHLDETSVPVLPGDLRLTLIKSKTCKLLYSASALRKSDAELLRDIRELDDELERWRLSMPEKYRPALSLPRTTLPGGGGGGGLGEEGTCDEKAAGSFNYHIDGFHGSGRGQGQRHEQGPPQGQQAHGHGHGYGYDDDGSGSGNGSASGSTSGGQRQRQKHHMSAESIRAIIISLQYHHLVATIHQATGRCRAWQGQSAARMSGCRVMEDVENASRPGEILMEGVSSSLALSVEASRSTLIYLRSVTRALLGEAFWVIILYPMSAVMNIFCSILLNPLDPQAEDDLRLLESAPSLIKGIRIRRPTQTELLHLKTVDDFMEELMRLGGCAIRRAREEQRQREMHVARGHGHGGGGGYR
ncbi:hypothetical protein QBC32DRAFT_74854 [Pseudoneurospora amorphoporcata]|uniref:Zn(2)-C6 fungal-type domain-containing protein n=1 Tax=Pseudoneurospora amorphoporcata TaxID=241081 RepID=A0AAN6P383_9PEZI|nr:hypothetical protein QBC32DRAFT_74854 [Pseudoneurospora amorphoporcata]